MFSRTSTWLIRLVTSTCLAVGISSTAFSSSDVEDFYRGRTLRILVGFSAGGGFDIYARVLARHMGKHIPGEPKITVQNMPGAGSVTAALNILEIAPKDGSVFGLFGRTVAVSPLMTGRNFDGTRFNWLGSITDEVSVCISGRQSQIRTWDDMLTKDFVVGGEGHESDLDINANLLKNVFGAKIKLVTGYPGTNEIKPAIERGEVDGVCGLSYSTLKSRYVRELEQNLINVLVQVSLKKNRDLPNVPFVGDFATPEQRDVVRLLLEPQAMARPFAAPPGIPEDRLKALRAAFDKTMQDPEFLAEAKKANLEVNPMTGVEVAKLVSNLYALPKDLGKKAGHAIATH
jgi:tripartite-type tricarboxylate transporter receptor subunit TctC